MKPTAKTDIDGDAPHEVAPDQGEPGAIAAKKKYRTPRLRDYGDVRSMTLGGSDAVGDSGSALRRNA